MNGDEDPPAPLINTRNGFTKPLHGEQILSWVGFFLMIAGYFLFIFPSLYPTERAICTPIFCVLWLIFNCLLIRAALEKHRSSVLPDDTKDNAIRCRWCKRTVIQGAKHCRSCNLCRLDFDHHCFFLNNCVTNDNYNYFLFGIIFLLLASMIESALSIYVVMGMGMKQENSARSMLANAEAFYGAKKKIPAAVWYVFHGLLLFMLLGIEYFITLLLGLHSCLIRKNITTFDVIQYRRMIDANKEAQKIAQNKKPAPTITVIPNSSKFIPYPPQLDKEEPEQPQLPEKEVSYSTSSKKQDKNEQNNKEKQKEDKSESSSDSSTKGKSESAVEIPKEEKEKSVSYSYSKSSSPKKTEPKKEESEQNKEKENYVSYSYSKSKSLKKEEPKKEEIEQKKEEEHSVSYSYSKSSKKEEIKQEQNKEEPVQEKEEEHSVSYSYSYYAYSSSSKK
ncbi:DHHC zinc finger domain containing protein [Trichomonas vaginalis G3]|uniref:Palmitoyltransferase n=1 Tax=Trichomonas vaginalis (strain ATCC PRA-98 / G3) TaxID=412133 RepID=A2ETG2_TRIV3|nr:cysteine S-palmitoyltransferase protein [Trichomonas vaginalis G3]EAY04082.1 DHHC zinc finger domain containing protein [Trichomonas vaginalis G3]KAI5513401.1 cysteine S-palmitoyltransferase protein [Trichomonas vaginalis G3]|eukprot:XP_001316305.1 DHHC zinc finger domain containing protein [Trichomonas vaginalis G3]